LFGYKADIKIKLFPSLKSNLNLVVKKEVVLVWGNSCMKFILREI